MGRFLRLQDEGTDLTGQGMVRATRCEPIVVVVITIVGAQFRDGTAPFAWRGRAGDMLRADTGPKGRSIHSPVTRTKSASVAALPDGRTSRLCRRYGRGWDGVARAIVADLSHLLPPKAPTWPSWGLGGVHYYRVDRSLVIDTYEGRWRDEKTGEAGTVFTLLVRLLGSWGAARRWLRDGGFVHGLGPGPRREPGGRRREREKGRTAGGSAEDRFWNPVRETASREAVRPARVPPPADQLELWPEESLEKVIRRNLEASEKFRAEEERRWQAEMAKLSTAERNYAEVQRAKHGDRHARAREQWSARLRVHAT